MSVVTGTRRLKTASSTTQKRQRRKRKQPSTEFVYKGVSYKIESQRKFRIFQTFTLLMAPNAASRVYSVNLTAVGTGDNITSRATNMLRIVKWFGRLGLRNNGTAPKYIRIHLVGIRGSESSADVTNWTDLLVDNGLVTSSLDGTHKDMTNHVNQNEYITYYDRVTRLSQPNASGIADKSLTIKKILKTICSYAYNSTVTRNGAIFFVMHIAEAAGAVASADTIDGDLTHTIYFQDIQKK